MFFLWNNILSFHFIVLSLIFSLDLLTITKVSCIYKYHQTFPLREVKDICYTIGNYLHLWNTLKSPNWRYVILRKTGSKIFTEKIISRLTDSNKMQLSVWLTMRTGMFNCMVWFNRSKKKFTISGSLTNFTSCHLLFTHNSAKK